MEDKKKKIIVGTSIVLILFIVLGISYAFLRNRIYGEKGKIVYHTSGLDVILEEDSTPSLELTGAVPMSDADGLKSDKIYRFTVVNRSISNLKYKIYLDNDNEALSECGEACEFIPDRDIKYEIKQDKSSINTLENRELADGRLVKGGRETYELKLWINSEAENEIVGKYFFGKIRVEVVQDYNNPKEPKLASNMIPVRYDGSNWVKASKNNWYDYEKQEWANAVTIDKDKVIDLSGNNNNGTLMNGASISNDGATLTDMDDSINIGLANYNFKDEFSAVIRFKLNQLPTTLVNGRTSLYSDMILKGGSISVNSIFLQALYDSDKNSLTLQYGTYYNGQADAHINDVPIELDNWYEVAIIFSKDKIYFYLDSKNVGEKAKATSWNYQSDTNIVIGDIDRESHFTINKLQVYNQILTENEIQKIYNDEELNNKDNMLIDYNFKKGENINNNAIIPMDLINTMWVWIPRYSYTIGSEDGTNYYGKQGEFLTETPTQALPGEIDVKFVDKNTKDRGSAKYKVSDGVSGWYTPDAFTFGTEELEGIWIGKFETSNKEESFLSDSENLTPIIKPKVTSWRNIRISTLETISMNMNKANNVYGFLENEVDTHAMKGSEWALVAYLSQSKYGKLGNKIYNGVNKEIYINNYNGYRTGCSSGFSSVERSDSCNFDYDDMEDRGEGAGAAGTGASTTGNIYGIYDMSGGAWEYIMSNFNGYTGNSQDRNSGYSGLLNDSSQFQGIPYPEEKYYNKYLTTDMNVISHALKETENWYGDSAYPVLSTSPWQMRGGDLSNNLIAGLFSFSSASRAGDVDGNISFRIVLTNKKIG